MEDEEDDVSPVGGGRSGEQVYEDEKGVCGEKEEEEEEV